MTVSVCSQREVQYIADAASAWQIGRTVPNVGENMLPFTSFDEFNFGDFRMKPLHLIPCQVVIAV